MFATAAAGALLLPALIQLVLVGGGLWLGASVAQRLFYRGDAGTGGGISPDGTIDVEARTVDDDWKEEMFRCGVPLRVGRRLLCGLGCSREGWSRVMPLSLAPASQPAAGSSGSGRLSCVSSMSFSAAETSLSGVGRPIREAKGSAAACAGASPLPARLCVAAKPWGLLQCQRF